MNKKFIRILAVIFAVGFVFSAFAACKRDKDGDKPSDSSAFSSTDNSQGGADVSQAIDSDKSDSSSSTEATSSSSSQTSSSSSESSQTTPASTSAPEVNGIDNAWAMFLVNNYNALPSNYTINTSKIQGDYVLDSRAAPYFLEMVKAAKADGVQLYITSSYRTVSYQEGLFNRRKNEYMAQGLSEEEAIAETAKYTAFPGKSEHNSGLAVDFWDSYTGLTDAFENTDQAQWLYKNAHKYGFVLRYPKGKEGITEIEYEPWHFRFVGVYHATKMYGSGLCLEEYYETLN